ncbi:Rib/alpha-like domain-containing protein, partial [Streptococcus sp. UMB0029]|uniref:Rib/alpha-like domain-containing protein n=1 Tax=Streptococcus sp. UMB0029 TaxID=2069308 RepID=UPI000C805998
MCTTGDVNPTSNGDGKTYNAPAVVAEIKPEVAGTPAVAAKLDGETAKEVKALDKTKLENYIAEIEAKLANGTYESKTEESVAVLKADLEAAKATLANATTQDEIKKAYNKLVTTANTKLKNKPVEKKETPAVDTTNGQPTVGKKAENTEKKSESNSIENTGSNDPRNGKALDKNNAFRAEVAYSEGTNAAANGHSDTYILNDVNKATSKDDAVNAVSRVTNYKVKYNKDASGKITSLDWLVFYNDHAENLSNTYNTDGGEVYRNFIQIPAEVNMPTSITRAKYNSPIQGKLNPKTKKLERIKPDGSALSSSVTFENPAPDTAAGLPLDKKDTFALASGWESNLYGRSIEKLAGQEDRYFKSAASNSSPRTKELLNNVALNDKRLIVDRSTTGGDGYDAYAWSFRTEVPATTSNEQLKDMKVVFGMMRSATAGANAAFANIATNPVKMWQSDVSPEPTAKDQTVKVGQKPDATKSIGNLDTLPKGTTVKYKNAVDTQTPGEKQATVVVTYPDTSTKEVPVKVIVEKEAVAPAKPVITTSLTGKANTKTPVEVKAEAGSTVSLFAHDGTKLGTAVANDQGVASITPTVNIPAGIVAATATKNGKTSEVSAAVEATPAAVTPQPETPKEETPAAVTPQPETPTTSGPEIVNDLAGKASTPADVTVKAPAGSTVKLYNTDGVVIGEAVANDQGVATVHPTNSLPAGEITATSTPAGGKESAKSAPITVTASPVTVKDGGVTGNNDTRLLVSRSEITVYPGDNIDIDVVAQATALEKFSVEKNPTAIKGVVPSGGYLGSSNGATIRQRDAKYSGTVAMDQPAGTTEVVFHAKNRDKPTTIYRALIVNVLETAKKYEPVAGTKVDIADSNGVSETEKNKIIEAVKTANPSLPADSQYSVDEKGNLTITYPDGSKDKIAAAYLVNPAPTDADKNTPTAKPQTVNKGTTPKAEDSIGNVKDLPKGTKVAFKAPVDTATPGEKDATVVVTYPDGSKEEVPVKVTVKAPSSAPTTPTAPATPVAPATPAAPAVAPTVEIPYSDKATKEVYVYGGEENSFDIKFKDDSGKITSAIVNGGGNQPFKPVEGEANTINTQYGFKANVISAETPATADAPAVITYRGTPAATDGLSQDKLDAATKGENPEGMVLGWRYATATDADGASIENKAVGSSNATDPGSFRVILKPQTQKYDIAIPAETEKVVVADPAAVTDAEFEKVKEKLKIEFSKTNNDANLAKDQGKNVEDKDAKIKTIEKVGNDLVVTYKDGSQDKKPLSEFVRTNEKPTVEIQYSDPAPNKKEVYVYASEVNSFDIKIKDDSGKLASAELRRGSNQSFQDVAGETNKQNTEYGFTANKFTTETTATAENPAVITYTGTPAPEGKFTKEKFEAAIQNGGTPLGWRFVKAIDKDGADARGNGRDATDPTAVNVILKPQTQKYDIKTPAEADKVVVSDVNNVTDKEFEKIKEKVKLEYSQNNPDARLADKKGSLVDAQEQPSRIQSITRDADDNVVVTYADGSKDKKPLSEFVTKKPTDADKNTPTAKPQTVNKGTTPKAEDSIGNVKDLPKGTKVAFKSPVDTTTPGEKDATVVVTYPDGSKEEVPVKVTVKAPSSAPDTKAPAKPEIKTDLTDKAGTKTPVEVSAEPGSKVELFDKDGNKIGEGVAGKDGKATITPTVELPAGDVTAKATDPAGNVSQPSTPEKATADTKAPSKPEINTDLTDKAGTKTPVEVSAEPGS